MPQTGQCPRSQMERGHTIYTMELNLQAALDQLTPFERNIIYLRFGLDNGNPQTLEEVGTEYGITRERVRQVQDKALRKLRSPDMVRIIIKQDSPLTKSKGAAHNKNTNNNKQHLVDGL